jgi:diguanylate cyclase (GGDEF)-like protein
MTVIDAIDDPVEPHRPATAQGSASELRLARALKAAQADVARLQQALARAEQLADRDPLTGLLNRRGFEQALAGILAACRRYRTDAALIYIDLDGFKTVNDRFGHAAGDETLKRVAHVLASGVRESDIIARLGGDEFAVILNRAGHAAAEAKAESLAKAVESAPSGPSGPIRLSYGIRTFEPGMEGTRMLAEADAAMFVRKGDRRRV